MKSDQPVRKQIHDWLGAATTYQGISHQHPSAPDYSSRQPFTRARVSTCLSKARRELDKFSLATCGTSTQQLPRI